MKKSLIFVFILAVTTAEHGSNLVGSVNIHIRLRNSSSITTAIDSQYACNTTTVDNNMRLLACRSGFIVR